MRIDRKSTRLNSSHLVISYAVFCLKKKISPTNSTLFTLNEIASVICAAAYVVTPLDQIVANRICTQYDIATELALKDAETFVDDLAAHGILLVSDQPVAGPANARGVTP